MYSYIFCSVNAVYIGLNMFSTTVHIMLYSYIVLSVNSVYIRLNMFSPTVHIMQCNVQLHF